jgi:pimeloyl-ACP methyl ester carboxylesterase
VRKRTWVGVTLVVATATLAGVLVFGIPRDTYTCMTGRWASGCRESVRDLTEGGVSKLRCVRPEFRRMAFHTRDSVRLVADYYPPPDTATPAPGVVLLHGGSPLGRRYPLITVLAARLQEHGYAVLVPDLRGYGDSEDPAPVESPRSWRFVLDARAAIDHLTRAGNVRSEVALVGHSFGGGVASAAALEDDRIQRLVLIGPPRRVRERTLVPGAPDSAWVLERAQADLRLDEAPSMETWRAVLEMEDVGRNVPALAGGGTPVLLMDAEDEHPNDIEYLRDLVAESGPAVEYVTIPDSDHYLTTGRILGLDCYSTARTGVALATLLDWLEEH